MGDSSSAASVAEVNREEKAAIEGGQETGSGESALAASESKHARGRLVPDEVGQLEAS